MNLIKKLFQSSATTAAELAAAAADVELQHLQAKSRLETVLATFGDRLATAGSAAELQRVEDDLANARKELERAEHLRASVLRRLQAAEETEQAERLAAQWDACEKALEARNAAIARMQSLALKMAAAIAEADERAADVWREIPESVKGKHWNTTHIAFSNNAPAIVLEIETAGRPVDPTAVRKTLHEQALESTRELLALRSVAGEVAHG